MKKKEAQIANKVSKALKIKIEVFSMPWAPRQLLNRAVGPVVKQAVGMETWSAKELFLTGYSKHPQLKKFRYIDIPIPIDHMKSRKAIKRIMREKGQSGMVQILQDHLAIKENHKNM
jgi:hypothetical protein